VQVHEMITPPCNRTMSSFIIVIYCLTFIHYSFLAILDGYTALMSGDRSQYLRFIALRAVCGLPYGKNVKITQTMKCHIYKNLIALFPTKDLTQNTIRYEIYSVLLSMHMVAKAM